MLNPPDPEEIVQNVLARLKLGENPAVVLSVLEQISLSDVLAFRSDNERKAFWINTYNAVVLANIAMRPEEIEEWVARKKFFMRKSVVFKNFSLSLDQVEHGILRRSRIWWSKGYLRNPFPGKIEKCLRVDNLDPRIHFALNCGGNGCPPIRHYSSKDIDQQLEIATKAFIHAEVSLTEKRIVASKIFSWYINDFGGKQGLKHFLHRYVNIQAHIGSGLAFKPYDWTPWTKQTKKISS